MLCICIAYCRCYNSVFIKNSMHLVALQTTCVGERRCKAELHSVARTAVALDAAVVYCIAVNTLAPTNEIVHLAQLLFIISNLISLALSISISYTNLFYILFL